MGRVWCGAYFSQPEISCVSSLEEEVKKTAILVSAFGNTTKVFLGGVRFGTWYSIIRSSGRSDTGTEGLKMVFFPSKELLALLQTQKVRGAQSLYAKIASVL